MHFSECGEWRLEQALRSCPVAQVWHPARRFLCSRQAFARWAAGREQLRMEQVYRSMRKRWAQVYSGLAGMDPQRREALWQRGETLLARLDAGETL